MKICLIDRGCCWPFAYLPNSYLDLLLHIRNPSKCVDTWVKADTNRVCWP